MQDWSRDGRPLRLVFGMLTTKNPREFLVPLAPFTDALRAVDIPDEALSFQAADLAERAKGAGIEDATASAGVREAIAELSGDAEIPGRILICGSLYLAGYVLKQNVESDKDSL